MTLPNHYCGHCSLETGSELIRGILVCSECKEAKWSKCCDELIENCVEEKHGRKSVGCSWCKRRTWETNDEERVNKA
jgi:hypothetical protein